MLLDLLYSALKALLEYPRRRPPKIKRARRLTRQRTTYPFTPAALAQAKRWRFRIKRTFIVPSLLAGGGIVPPRSNLSWKRFPNVYKRRLALYRRLIRQRRTYPITALVLIVWRRLRQPRLHSRPLWRFFRPKHIVYQPPQPSNLSWKRAPRAKIRRWRTNILKLAKLRYIIPVQPVGFIAWKKPPRPKIKRGRRFTRQFAKYVIPAVVVAPTPVVQAKRLRFRIKRTTIVQTLVAFAGNLLTPSSLSWKRPPNVYRRKPALYRRLTRQRRTYPIVAAVPQVVAPARRRFRIKRAFFVQHSHDGGGATPQTLFWRALRRLRLHSRPAARFFRPKKFLILPPAPPTVVAAPRRWWRLKRTIIVQVTLAGAGTVGAVTPAPATASLFKRPPRARIRRMNATRLRAHMRLGTYIVPTPPVSIVPFKRPPRAKIRRMNDTRLRGHIRQGGYVIPGTTPPPTNQFTVSGPGVIDLFDPVTGVNYTFSPTQRRTV